MILELTVSLVLGEGLLCFDGKGCCDLGKGQILSVIESHRYNFNASFLFSKSEIQVKL